VRAEKVGAGGTAARIVFIPCRSQGSIPVLCQSHQDANKNPHGADPRSDAGDSAARRLVGVVVAWVISNVLRG